MFKHIAIMPPAEVATYLINLALAVCLVCGVGLLAARVFRLHSAPLRHGILVWTLALTLLSPAAVWLAQHNGLALFRFTLSGPSDASGAAALAGTTTPGVSDAASAQSASRSADGTAPTRNQITSRRRSISSGHPDVLSSETSPMPAASSAASPPTAARPAVVSAADSPAPTWWQAAVSVAALLWATGVVVGLLRLGYGCVALARFCRRLDPLLNPRQKSLICQTAQALRLRKTPPIFLSPSVNVPVSIGLLQPVIVLPKPMAAEMDDDQLQAVLLHEMAHIARRDHLVGVGQRIASVVFWWNPLVHWACGEISELREEICDNYVVLVQGEGRRLALVLVELAAQAVIRPLWPSTIGVLEPKLAGLTGRVTRLINKERNMETRMSLRSKVFVLVCSLSVLVAMASVGALRLAHAQPPQAAGSAAADVSETTATAQKSADVGAKIGAEVGALVGDAIGAVRSDDRFEFRGQVLDPDGKPLPGAKIYIIFYTNDTHAKIPPPKLRATTGPDGNFQFSMAKSEFDTLRASESWGAMDDVDYKNDCCIVAMADSCGLVWQSAYAFDPSGEILNLVLKTHPEDSEYANEKLKPLLRMVKDDVPLVGRIIDADGRPVAGVKVNVLYIEPTKNEDLTGWVNAVENEKADEVDTMKFFSVVRRPHGSFTDNVISSEEIPQLMPAAISDADGKFRLTGIGRERIAGLSIEESGIETACMVHARTRPGPTLLNPYHRAYSPQTLTYYGATFEHVARPSIPIVGTVRDKDTGKPLSGVTIQAHKLSGNLAPNYVVSRFIRTTTDDSGRYRLTGMPIGKDNELLAVPPQDQPYLLSKKTADTTADKDSMQVDFELKQGTWIRGKITDAKTGEPVQCCMVEYYVFLDNPHYKSAPGFDDAYMIGLYQAKKDGQYAVPGLPGRGIVVVRAYGNDEERYPLRAGVDKIPELRKSGGMYDKVAPTKFYYYSSHALAEVNPAEGAQSIQQDFQLDPGQTLKGVVLDPAGKALSGAHYSGLTTDGSWNPLNSDKFTVNGYWQNQPRKLLFIHLEQKLAGSLIITGPQTAPLSVQLQPWGVITGRVVDADGKPMVGIQIWNGNVSGLEDGYLPRSLWRKGPDGQLQRVNDSFRTDQDGGFRIEGLAPGIKYTLWAMAQQEVKFLGSLISGVTLEPGQTKDLGNLTPKSF